MTSTSPKLLSHLHRLADTAVSEGVRGLANAAASHGPEAGAEADLVSAAHEFAAAGAAYLAHIGTN